jgi:flagellar basal body-associated protein FliL
MKNETNEAKKSKEKTEGIDDFKNDIDQMRSKTKDQRLLAALIVLVVLVFLSLGVGFYQIFIKPVPIEETKTSEEKIESKPEIPAQETPAPSRALHLFRGGRSYRPPRHPASSFCAGRPR